MKPYLLFILGLFFSMSLFAQTAKISGKITDKETNEPIIGAVVQVLNLEPQKAALTDFDGIFNLNNVPVGTYTIKISALSYQTKEVSNVVLLAGQKLSLDISLETQSKETKEIVIVGTMEDVAKENVESMLLLQKKTPSNVSSISADVIKKLPDRTAGDVVRRISGTSIQDGRYVIVRGLNERYNTTMVNGSPMPSTETDRKAFSFDLIPANLLDNIMIYKTATPDLPGDFAGGVVQINTKDIAEENQQNFSFSSSYNQLSTFKPFYQEKGSFSDLLGLKNNQREIPAGVPANNVIAQNQTFAQNAEDTKLWKHSYVPTFNKSMRPSISAQYFISRRFKIKARPSGFLLALNYNNSSSFSHANTVSLRNPSSTSVYYDEGNYRANDVYRIQTMVGGLLNFSIRPFEKTKVSLKNLFNVSTDRFVALNTVNNRKDQSDSAFQNSINKETVFSFASNKLLSSNLFIDQKIGGKISLKVNLSSNFINRSIPDYRKIIYQSSKGEDDNGDYYYKKFLLYTSPNSNFAYNSGRFFQFLTEKNFSEGFDLDIPVDKIKTNFKVGSLLTQRSREVTIRTFSYDLPLGYENSNDISTILVNKNFTANGIKLTEKESNGYEASSSLAAFYGMFDCKIIPKLRAIGGVRYEKYNQKIIAEKDTNDQVFNSFLPSATLIYSPIKNVNIKLSGSQTVSRPEFRELAPVNFYDYLNNFIVNGNPKLIPTKVTNFDFKAEYYFKPGQFIAISPFVKTFYHPTELIVEPAEGAPSVSYTNSNTAKMQGLEIEGRVNILSSLSFSGNLALIKSEINVNRNKISVRPMQGQSPYVVNLGLNYDLNKYFINTSLNVNKIGDRIAFDGMEPERIIYEKSRFILDYQINKLFFKQRLSVRYQWSDILAQSWILFQDINNNKKFDKETDISYSSVQMAARHSISLSFKF